MFNFNLKISKSKQNEKLSHNLPIQSLNLSSFLLPLNQ